MNERVKETETERYARQGIDSRALLAVFLRDLPVLLGLAAGGAILGIGFHLLAVFVKSRDIVYVSETGYYIEFAPGRYEAKDYYNAFTWNDVIMTDLILGRAMEFLEGCGRDQVKQMITAQILSDVRYLTVTVRGRDPDKVEAVRDALKTALEEFGARMEEFDAIYQIEELETAREKIPYFVWQAAFLGAVLSASAGGFVIALRFSVGSSFYAKGALAETLGFPVYGMTFSDKHMFAKAEALAARQAELLKGNMELLASRHDQVFFMDASEGRYAEAFLRHAADNGYIAPLRAQLYRTGQARQDDAVIVVVPFGKPYREKITDEIDQARLRGCRVEGAVLVDADRLWEQIYYGRM